jgi:hypothetical protein
VVLFLFLSFSPIKVLGAEVELALSLEGVNIVGVLAVVDRYVGKDPLLEEPGKVMGNQVSALLKLLDILQNPFDETFMLLFMLRCKGIFDLFEDLFLRREMVLYVVHRGMGDFTKGFVGGFFPALAVGKELVGKPEELLVLIVEQLDPR